MLMYTSGTTGRPKGTDLPPAIFVGGATVDEHLARLGAGTFAAYATHLVAGPLYHTGPLAAVRMRRPVPRLLHRREQLAIEDSALISLLEVNDTVVELFADDRADCGDERANSRGTA